MPIKLFRLYFCINDIAIRYTYKNHSLHSFYLAKNFVTNITIDYIDLRWFYNSTPWKKVWSNDLQFFIKMGSTFGACVAYLATFIVTNIMKKVLMLFHVSFKWDLKLSATPSSSNISTTLKCRRQNKWHSIFKTYIHFKEERFILSLQSLVNSWKLSFWWKRKAFSYTTKC